MIRFNIIGFNKSDKGAPRWGDCTIIDDGMNYLVIDGYCGIGTTRLISRLKKLKVKDPVLFISHAHYDHYYGIRKIIGDTYFEPVALYMYDPHTLNASASSDVKSEINTMKKIMQEANDRGIPVKFLKDGDEVFATYASAIETYRGRFQPSGTDYIIHVLGSNARTGYIQKFRELNPRYAATIRETYNPWEYWAKNANWFFYRELYQHYSPAYANDYELFWTRSGKNQIHQGQASFRVEKLDDHTVRISVSAPGVTAGIADVSLSYQVRKKPGRRSRFMFNKMVLVSNESGFRMSENDMDELGLDRMHINMSVESDDGKDYTEPFMAGIMKHIRDITLFLNPSEQSYARLGRMEAPRYVSWAVQNRSQLIRIPADPSGRRRIELRSPDPQANPYLAFALLIRAGIYGIDHNLALPPASLQEAVQTARSSDLVREYVPAACLKAYAERAE